VVFAIACAIANAKPSALTPDALVILLAVLAVVPSVGASAGKCSHWLAGCQVGIELIAKVNKVARPNRQRAADPLQFNA
jgi:hypothetical protein